MTHKEWIKKQFDKERTKPSYRNVLIHASFIETIIRSKVRGSDFENAIVVLRPKYKNEPFNTMDFLRGKRNNLVHGILRNKKFKTEQDITGIIREMSRLIKKIYRDSELIDSYFLKNFGFSPKP
ncbi:MAG: hypothetical protein Q7R93_00990 [bacterium]|nr:hypothetical protein [bacterium]